MSNNLKLGDQICDRETGIHGIWVAFTEWFDRSNEVAILRSGVDCDGRPWDIHWFPETRVERYDDSR